MKEWVKEIILFSFILSSFFPFFSTLVFSLLPLLFFLSLPLNRDIGAFIEPYNGLHGDSFSFHGGENQFL